ncbi:MAG: DUF1810 domain-containing protein [Lachnospiraceae bacterium]|nr:DUF1810 domain-containing protein [Lachnospiraceae bacterium]MDD7077220.1 DUF1810 domain-containing protein [Lachnospiraceae bacterium]MDY3728817.1 DUF1810 domain-containing protein [Candidatus Choladocola sp.]
MHDLERFYKAQEYDYETALSEIRNGRKESHWMWYIFPQITGLGRSTTAEYYAIKSKEEAKGYIEDPVLGKRLIEISQALFQIESDDAEMVMGWPDNLKLRSCMTLFAEVAPEQPVFRNVLEKFYDGEMDGKTLDILKKME